MDTSFEPSGDIPRIRYRLPQIDRIGHLVTETFYLRNLFDPNVIDITLITFPPTLERVANFAVYEFVTRGFKLEYSEDRKFMFETHRKRGSLQPSSPNIIDNLYWGDTAREFLTRYHETKSVPFFFELAPADLEKGARLRDTFSVPQDAKIITFHCREGGYLRNMEYHSYRDCTVARYLPILEYLIEQGYYVIRLGDTSMSSINLRSSHFIDMTNHPRYEPMIDLYFIAVSDFYLGTQSGPVSLARALGVPRVITNCEINYATNGFESDIIVPRQVFSQQLNRYLTLGEILTSPVINFSKAEEFERNAIRLVENTSEEILLAVQEMESRLAGTYATEAQLKEFYQPIRELERIAHLARLKDYPLSPLQSYLTEPHYSIEFIKLNPDFLGHYWKDMLV